MEMVERLQAEVLTAAVVEDPEMVILVVPGEMQVLLVIRDWDQLRWESEEKLDQVQHLQVEEQAIQEQVITAEAAVVEDQLESQTYQSYTLVRAVAAVEDQQQLRLPELRE